MLADALGGHGVLLLLLFGVLALGGVVEDLGTVLEQGGALLELLGLGDVLLQLLELLISQVLLALGEDVLCRLLLGGDTLLNAHVCPPNR